MANKLVICKTCYRASLEKEMMRNVAGRLTDQCKKCYDIIGKGPGYDSAVSEEEANKWFEDSNERKKGLERDGFI